MLPFGSADGQALHSLRELSGGPRVSWTLEGCVERVAPFKAVRLTDRSVDSDVVLGAMQVRGRLGAVMSAQGSVLSLSVGRMWPARIERLECVLRKTAARLDAAAPRLTAAQGAHAATQHPPLRLLP